MGAQNWSEESGIYRIVSPSGKVYIGQAVNIKKRLQKYSSGNVKGQRRLYESFKKHGVQSHEFEVLELCDKSVLLNRERYYQDKYDAIGVNGLNCKLTTTSDRSGHHSEQTRLKISMSNKGKRCSDEAKEKMRAAKIGKKMPEKQRILMVGRTLSESTKMKISQRLEGNTYSLGRVPANAKKILDRSTGLIYESTRSAADFLGVKQRTLQAWLYGENKNKSNMELM